MKLFDDLECPEYFSLLLPIQGIRTLKDISQIDAEEIRSIEDGIRNQEVGGGAIDYESKVEKIRYFGFNVIDFPKFKIPTRDAKKLLMIAKKSEEVLAELQVKSSVNLVNSCIGQKRAADPVVESSSPIPAPKKVKLSTERNEPTEEFDDNHFEIVDADNDDLFVAAGKSLELDLTKCSKDDLKNFKFDVQEKVAASANLILGKTTLQSRIESPNVIVEFTKGVNDYQVSIKCFCNPNKPIQLSKNKKKFNIYGYKRHVMLVHLKEGKHVKSKGKQMKMTDFSSSNQTSSSGTQAENETGDIVNLLDEPNARRTISSHHKCTQALR